MSRSPTDLATDPRRLQALAGYALLDTPPEPAFDDLARLAAQLCQAPMALVSLVDGGREWFKARYRFSPLQFGLDTSLGLLGMERAELLVIPDLAHDPRTRDHPQVRGEPGLRFYAGAPLCTGQGHCLGMLCVLDTRARPQGLDAAQAESLRMLAAQVMAQLELRASQRRQREHDLRYRQIVESAIDFAIIACDLDGRVTEWNRGAERILGWTSQEMRGCTVERIFTPEDRTQGIARQEMETALRDGQAQDERWHLRQGGERFWASGQMMPLRDAAEEHIGFLKILRDRTPQHLAGEALERARADLALAQRAGGVGVFWIGPDHIVHASPEFCRLYGLPEQDGLPASAFEDCVLPEDRHRMSTAASREQGTAPCDVEYRIRRADTGELRWIARRGNFEPGTGGGPLRFAGAARDITQLVQDREALQRSDERYRTLFDSMEQGFAILEVLFDDAGRAHDWRYLETNEVFERHSGLPDALGRTVRELVPEIEAFWPELYGEVALTGKSASLTRYVPAMGRWFDISAMRIGDAAQRQVGVLFSDVTPQKRAEQHQAALLALGDGLRDQLAPPEIARVACRLLGQTLGVSLVGYGLVDENAETIAVETGWTADGSRLPGGPLRFRDYGDYVDDLLQGHTVVVGDAHRDPRTRDHVQALERHAAVAFVNSPILERGRFVALFFVTHPVPRVWHEAELALIREFGERTRIASERAQSALVQAEQAARLAQLNASLAEQVRERTEDRNALWQLSRDIMLRARFDGVIVAVNPAWQDVLDWTEAELIGCNLMALVHPDDLERTHEGARMLAQGQPLGRFDNRYRRRDGSYRWISWTTRSGDGLINAVGRDVTEEREATEALQRSEAALRQSQKMEAVGQLTGGLAHDFNNLLAAIAGALELMSVRLRQGRLQDLERYVGTAQGAARRAAALTHRLLAFSRRQTLDPKVCEVGRLVTQMEELLRRSIGPEVHLDVRTSDGLWTTLIDPPQLENALLNLCLNARDAMPAGGRITVETVNQRLDERAAAALDVPPGPYLALRVSDTGAGMSPETAAKAFDPFFTTKPLGQGTGLGLSMVYGFVRQSGGQVRIHSALGQGTTVSLYLPRHLGEPEPAQPAASAPIEVLAEDGRTVLVVDDEASVRMLVAEVLQDMGLRVVEAGDSASGLRLLDSDLRVDLLVSDVGLPGGMNGRQMADAARVRRPGLKVLFITGYAETTVLGQGQLGPGMQVMTKPFPIEQLASRVRELLR